MLNLSSIFEGSRRLGLLALVIVSIGSQTSCNAKFGENDEGEIVVTEASGSKIIVADTKSCINFVGNAAERDVEKSYIFFNKINICWGAGQNPGARLLIRSITLNIPKGQLNAYSKSLDEPEIGHAINVDTTTLCIGCQNPDPLNSFAGAIVPQNGGTKNGCVTINSTHSSGTCGRLIYGGLSFAGADADDPPPTSVFELGTLVIDGEVEDGDDVRQVRGQVDVKIEL